MPPIKLNTFHPGLIFLFFIAFLQFPVDAQATFNAEQGVLDLRSWTGSEPEVVSLNGDWSFYWNQLLEPEDINQGRRTAFVPVPDPWNSYDIPDLESATTGFATYSLTLLLPDAERDYEMLIDNQGSACRLWIDGKEIYGIGTVGTSRQTTEPGNLGTIINLSPADTSVQLVLQIANFHHRKGGFRNSLSIGRPQTLSRTERTSWFFEGLSVGILLIMGLYHLFITLFRRRSTASLYFAILCWMCMVRVGVVNTHVLEELFPALSWSAALRMEYLVFFLAPVPFVFFVREVFPGDVHKLFTMLVAGIGTAFALFLVFTDTLALSHSANPYQYIYLTQILYYGFLLGRIIHRRRPGAFYFTLASLILFVSILADTLILRESLPVRQVVSYGFLGFIFMHSLLLSSRFSKSFQQVEQLSRKLEAANATLAYSENKYRELFEESKDVIFLARMDTGVEDVSPSCLDVLGYTREELIGGSTRDVVVDDEVLDGYRQTVLAEGSVSDAEMQLRKKDGSLIHALVTISRRMDAEGKNIGFQGSIHDLTSRKEAEADHLRALEMEQLALRDPLTSVYNRRFFDASARIEIDRGRRTGTWFSIALFDIDHFKNVNDTYGHLAGDSVITELAGLASLHTRSGDLVARFGGDEFIVLMPDTDMATARGIAERLRGEVETEVIRTQSGEEISITISLGIVSWDPDKPTEIDMLLEKADRSLYQAKERGRNRIGKPDGIDRSGAEAVDRNG